MATTRDPANVTGFQGTGTDSLPPAFVEQMETLRYLTLTELVERIIRMFSLNEKEEETPYLVAFQDTVIEFGKNHPADIHSFLSWWEEHADDLALTVSEEQDAIRVMTIHKAKGLQFPVVIIPYCHWSFDHRGMNALILWCRPTTPPFNHISLLPVKYSSALQDTYFEQAYHAERFRVYVDHLNLMYVAFTRAMEGLFIFAPLPARAKLTDAADMIYRVLGGNSGHSWTSGDFSTIGRAGGTVKPEQLFVRNLVSHEFSAKLRLQYRGINFFDTAAEQRMQQGNIMHEVFSKIRSADDIHRAIDAVRREGMIEAGEAVQMKDEISRLISSGGVREWFEGGWRVITEQDILTPGGTVKRPDRVMMKENQAIVVDYKFGRLRSTSHMAQVRKYVDMLRQMNVADVSGFVWYVNLGEVVAV